MIRVILHEENLLLGVTTLFPGCKHKEAVTLGIASLILGKIGPSVFYLDVRLVIVRMTISDEAYKDRPLDYLMVIHFELFALSVLVFTDTFITNLVTAREVFRRNEIVGRPVQAIRAEMPSIGA